MWKTFKNSKFCEKWKKFFLVFLSPWPLIFLALSGISIWLSLQYKDNLAFSTLISIIAVLFSGLAGSFIKDELGSSILENKGLSAVRNLSSINFQIKQIRNWIKLFISKKKKGKEALEEIYRHLSTTETNIDAGLNDWVDIVPELRKSSEAVKSYEDVLREYFEEFLKNKKELLAVGNNIELKEKLEKRIKELEKEMKGLKKEPSQMLSHSLGGTMISSGLGSSVLFSNKTCSVCGKTYIDDFSSPMLYGSNICPECRKNYPDHSGYADIFPK